MLQSANHGLRSASSLSDLILSHDFEGEYLVDPSEVSTRSESFWNAKVVFCVDDSEWKCDTRVSLKSLNRALVPFGKNPSASMWIAMKALEKYCYLFREYRELTGERYEVLYRKNRDEIALAKRYGDPLPEKLTLLPLKHAMKKLAV